MARTEANKTWENGFAQPSATATWNLEDSYRTEDGEKSHYAVPSFEKPLSSTIHNSLGLNTVRTWPSLHNGTESPQGVPGWWQPRKEVDVLICGAGPFGLAMALSLARQGVTFRIIDKGNEPITAGRADAMHPRSLEILHSWGVAEEFHEEGPLLDHSVVYRNGVLLQYNRAFQSDSRYRGMHTIPQNQIERIFIRDILRHKMIVERSTILDNFEVKNDISTSHPVEAQVKNTKSGDNELIKAKFLIGAEGAASSIRKQLAIPFDGLTTDIHWGIMDCKWETDYPHITTFGLVLNREHGGCIVIPREDGYTRIYTRLDAERVKELAEDRREAGGRVDVHSITPDELLEQTNKVFAPYTVRFAAPLAWFAIWKVSERAARTFSSPDLRVHIGGDAAHVHSVVGAFGMNTAIYDAANLGWKLGLCARNLASPAALLPTYDLERRTSANRVIRVSGAFLRFISGIALPLAELRNPGDVLATDMKELPPSDGTRESDLMWCDAHFRQQGTFILGLEVPNIASEICPLKRESGKRRSITIESGRRAPNPRICFDKATTGYLYDSMVGIERFHILIFGSDLQGPVRERIGRFSQQALGPQGFFATYGGKKMFNIVLVLKALPFEKDQLLHGDDMRNLRDYARVVYDDRAPDEDAGYWYGINHARGAVVAVRPDLCVGTSCWPEEDSILGSYFKGFLLGNRGPGNGGLTKGEMTNGGLTNGGLTNGGLTNGE